MADPGANGSVAVANATAGAGDDNGLLSKIHDALQIIYTPHSTNQSRHEAQAFLEEVKALSEGPSHGFTLASDKSQSPIVRHYGLSLLEHAIKHKWAEYTEQEAAFLRNWVLQLSQAVSREDPQYIRNKVALLWVEVAKRSWAAEWMDMDAMLVQLWQVPGLGPHKELVLSILETLSDEIFNGDDAVVAVREGVLSKAAVEIFTPATVLAEAFPNRQTGPDVRCGEEGWLNRVSAFLNDCLSTGVENNEDARSCAVKSLKVLYSLLPWAIPKAIIVSRCVHSMCDGLGAPDIAVRKASLESLHALYARSNFSGNEFRELVVPMYSDKFVERCKELFAWSTVDVDDLDDDKYQFSKKFSEMLSCIGNYLDRKFDTMPPGVDIQAFLDLLLTVVQSQSLVVSIPVLVTWTRLLQNRSLGPAIAKTRLIGPLLVVCSSRLVRYESLPEDTQDPTYILLMEDTDTVPERHAFLGNYRRYSSQVIENVVQLTLSDAISYILDQADNVLRHLYDGQPPLNPSTYTKNSMPYLRVDGQLTVIESALKGYVKWRAGSRDAAERYEQQRQQVEQYLESWCNQLIQMQFEDPLIRKRILQLLVAFSTGALDKNTGFMLKVLEHILMTWPATQPEHKVFNDAIKDFQSESIVELQRLASKMPDHLLDVYDQLEAKVNDMIASGSLDEKRQVAYQSFLFLVIHRATRIDPALRLQRLQAFIRPVTQQWQNENLKQALSSYAGFARLMALDKAQTYLARRQIHKITDWGAVELDAEGLALQAELEERQMLLPLRSTKSFLTYSVEKLEKNSPSYEASCALWQDGIPVILPELLQFLAHAHATHNPSNWSLLPNEMQSIVERVLTDRFWQAGISEGSKDDFYARVLDKKGTLEGLASSIRGSVRFVRETSYAIIYCMSRLDVQFYGFEELPGPLAHALFADSSCLSAHQIINLLNLVRYLVDHCPVDLREHFLPPLLAACFQQMDSKISSQWEKLDRQQSIQSAGDELTEEMKAESILRQLTYSAVVMLADFLDPARTDELSDAGADGQEDGPPPRQHPSLRRFCLMQFTIAEPLLMFCAHAIRMHDSRCCGVVLRVFRSIIPEFVSKTSPSADADSMDDLIPPERFPIPPENAAAIREFISSEVLKACITSLHEPYFVDLQKELGHVIAFILIYYSPLTQTPREVLCSLPNIKQQDVDTTIEYLSRPGMHSRQQRALVLDLLKDLKGVSISEMGKLSKSIGLRSESSRPVAKKPLRSKMAQEFMTAPPPEGRPGGPDKRESPDLEGVAGLFNT
ncbi:Nuclear import and export protein Msn5 [Pleurostoma richardsiae]|uniref:Nuclear import and export protein Msn5 n=1 Tax=Pleurostoma richardsiae TaxID=41990 RepID=A0AA38R3V4_9PEZI|nr:Nuclear import and export protein Msn5 [Pleurostoma richardsiae]